MAGRVKIHVEVRKANQEWSVVPIPCPAVKEQDGQRPACMRSRPDEAIRICPFLLYTESMVEGMLLRHRDAESLILDYREWPNDRDTYQGMCLKQESTHTPIGAI